MNPQRRFRIFLGAFLLGLVCYVGRISLTAYTHGDWMLPVMLLYFLSIALTTIGGVGLVVCWLLSRRKK